MHLWGIASVYPIKIPTQPPGTLTHPLMSPDPASGSTGPSSSPSSCLSLTVAFSWLLLSALFCWLLSVHCPVTLPSLVFFRSRRTSPAQAVWVGFAIKQTKEYSDWHSTTPIETNATYRATLLFMMEASKNFKQIDHQIINKYLSRRLIFCGSI